MDLAPLRTSRDFRFLFSSRTVTLLGTQAADFALLVQAERLTGSAFDLGLLGAVELGESGNSPQNKNCNTEALRHGE